MCLRNSILLLWCLFLTYGEARSEDAKEQEKLEGTWSFVSSSGGASEKKEKRAAVRMVFKGDTVSFVAEGNKRTVQGTYTVGLSKTRRRWTSTWKTTGRN